MHYHELDWGTVYRSDYTAKLLVYDMFYNLHKKETVPNFE